MHKLRRHIGLTGVSALICCQSNNLGDFTARTARYTSYSDDSLPRPSDSEDLKEREKEKESPCAYYNSIEQRISWAERRTRCNGETGCKFLGRRFSGTCVPSSEVPIILGSEKEHSSSELKNGSEEHSSEQEAIPLSGSRTTDRIHLDDSQVSLANDTTTGSSGSSTSRRKHRLYAEIVTPAPEGSENEFTAPLRVLVHETLRTTAVDSIRDSQELANELAKCLVLEVLDRKENRGKLGEFLQYIFVSDTVLSPTRELIYWSLTLDDTVKNTIFYTNMHRDYWLGLSAIGQHVRTRRGVERQIGAKELTQAALLDLTLSWLQDPVSRTAVINPLLEWTLRSQECVIAPLATLTAESIPWAKEATVEGIIYVVSESLKSEEVRKAAADALVSFFKATGKTEATEDKDDAAQKDDKDDGKSV